LSDGLFTSEEHVFPAGLGNQNVILPPGFVCDRCNNGPLSTVDGYLLAFPPIGFIRTLRSLRTRSGRIPPSEWANAAITSDTPGHVNVVPTEEGVVVENSRDSEGRVELSLNLRSSETVTLELVRKLARSLYKMGLECVCLDHPDFAFDAQFDELRQIVLGRVTRPGWMIIHGRGVPDETVQLRYWLDDYAPNGDRILPVAVSVFGLKMEIEILARDPGHLVAPDPPPELATVYRF
jgi:hypothetical protein